jgi:Mg-chelatase subunit ChlD
MKFCPECGVSNIDSAKFCTECGKALGDVVADAGISSPRVDSPPIDSPRVDYADIVVPSTVASSPELDERSFAEKIGSERLRQFSKQRQADILFVLDCTGSMGGEIDAIRDAITNFADTISSDGVRVRVGLIEFRDRLYGEEHRALLFAGEPFTQDAVAFRQQVALLKAGGGGDEPESSLDALLFASRQPFAADASKVLVLVTDAPPHIPDKEVQSIEEVQAAFKGAAIDQLYLVIRTQDAASQVYLKLLSGRKGLAFDLGKGDDFRKRSEDFKRTLMALGKTISQATR